MMIFSQITALDAPELSTEMKKAERELLELTMAVRMQQEKNVAKRKKMRRYLARLHTAFQQKNVSRPLNSAAS